MSKYHKGDKFAIEIDEVFENNADDFIHEEELYRIKGFNSLVFDDNGLDKLQKYETFTVRPDAWDESLKEQYNKGLEDAIKLARKLYEMPVCELEQIFDGHSHMTDVLDNYDYIEILAKLEAYEKEQEEIKVGDVVEGEEANVMGVVVRKTSKVKAHILFRDGSAGLHELKDLKKTGKHIDLADLFKQIGGGE